MNPVLSWEAAIDPFWKVAVAAILAGIIGIERETKQKPAGFRTLMLTGGAASLLVVLGPFVIEEFMGWGIAAEAMRVDPLRIIEAIIVGVSFIGAGTVLKVPEEHRVEYLTTAASILFAAGIGIAVAVGQHLLAAATVLLVLVVNSVLGHLERRFEDRSDAG